MVLSWGMVPKSDSGHYVGNGRMGAGGAAEQIKGSFANPGAMRGGSNQGRGAADPDNWTDAGRGGRKAGNQAEYACRPLRGNARAAPAPARRKRPAQRLGA